MKAGRIAWSIVGFLAVSAIARASEPVQILTPSDAGQGYGDGFGSSVAISGDWLVIGAPSDDELAGEAGAAYVFRREGARWVEHQKLYGLPLFGETFGAVAIDGDWIVVGAPAATDTFGNGTGRGFVFRRDERWTSADLSDDIWFIAAFLNPPPSHLRCGFGSTVRIDGNVIVVGSVPGEFDPGRAYVFHWDGVEWIGPQTIMPFDSHIGDEFGWGVAVSGDIVAVTAPRDIYPCPVFGECSGSAYIFRGKASIWKQEAKIVAEGTRGLGGAIGASKNRIVVAGWGAAHVFQRTLTEWTEETVLTPSDPPVNQFAAYHLAINGNRILVGAADEFWGYLFELDHGAWAEVAKLKRPDGLYFSRVSLDGAFALALRYVYAIGEPFSLADFAAFQNCYGQAAVLPGCGRFDLEPNDLIDASDLPMFLLTFIGPE